MGYINFKDRNPSIPEIIQMCEEEIEVNPKNPTVYIAVPTSKYKQAGIKQDGNVVSFTHAFPLKGEIMTQNPNLTTLKYDPRKLLKLIRSGLPQPFLNF